jgi:hypothetical protein
MALPVPDQQLGKTICSRFGVQVAKIVGASQINAERAARYAKAAGRTVGAESCMISIAAELSDGAVIDYVAVVRTDATGQPLTPAAVQEDAFLMATCKISYDDLSPTQLIEYCFPDEPPFPTWHMAGISLESFSMFSGSKFKLWEKQLKEPSCEAAFRRLLQAGPVFRVYDPAMFPTPPELESRYRVVDEKTGKLVPLPHPIAKCRVWNAKDQKYDDVDASLDGAPKSEGEATVYWSNLLTELRSLHGAEYIDSLLKGEEQKS